MTKEKALKYLDLPYYSACGCKLEIVDDGLRTLFTRCPLHAAAPDLLEALKDCAEWADGFDDKDEPSWIKRVRDAIAKAEGR